MVLNLNNYQWLASVISSSFESVLKKEKKITEQKKKKKQDKVISYADNGAAHKVKKIP